MADTIEIIQGTATTVEVAGPTGPQGPAGSAGATGAQGPQGVPGTGLEVLTTQGDLLYQGASTGQRLPIGTTGQILKVNSGGTAPEWGAAPAGGVSSVNGETGTVILDGSEIESSANDDRAALTAGAFGDGNGIYYPLPDTTLNSKRVYRATSGHHVFFQSLRWHITDGSPITANIIESSDDDNAAWPWLSAWSGDVDKAKIADVIGRARDTFLFVGDSVPNTSVSGLGTAATADSTAFAAASHTHGNLTNSGAVGTTANLPLKTGTNGVVEAGSFGTSAGTFCEGNDARLSDARTPSSTLAHKESHAISGSDFLAPSDIGAQSIFTRSSLDIPVSGPLQLSAARAAIVSVTNNRPEARDVYLPMTSIQNGDIIVVVGATLVNPINIKVPAASGAAIVDPNGGAVTISVTGQQYRFIVDGVGNFIPWTRVNVDTHTHVVADVTGAAASGSITTSGLTQATARILGRTSASTGAVEEIQIGSGLSLSAGELSSTVSAGIPATLLDAKGDLIVGSADNTAARLAVGGTNGHVLTVDSAESLGVKWAAAAGGVGGGTGSTDNSILRSDGTGGSTLQASGLVIEDTVTAFTTITGDAGTDIITATGSAFANGQRVRFTALTGGTGLNTTTNYFVINVSGATFQLSTTDGGSASLFTTNITAGTLLTGHAVQPLVQISNAASDTNSALVLTPKGTGSISAQVPDATTAGGDARGVNATDFQRVRGNANQVASGERSFIAGGVNNRASGTNSFIGGCNDSVASGTSSCVVGSWSGNATSNRTTVISSFSSTASGEQTAIICGRDSSATAEGALAIGREAVSNLVNMIAEGNGGFAAQHIRFNLRGTTTTNSAVELLGGAGGNRLRCPSGKAMFMNVKILGIVNGGGTVSTFERQYAIKNVSGTTSQVFAPVTIGTDNAASTTIALSADDANDTLKIECTGLSATTIRWSAHVSAIEMSYG
jgi:hypothetical protein